jgi:uncharacterized membrane protein YdjX (TVP38/TMEM64 family)
MKSSYKFVVWLTVVVLAVLGVRWLNNNYTLDEMRTLIVEYDWYILLAYAGLISIRGVLFVPTLPFILLMASVVDPLPLFTITLLATCCSTYFVCVAVDNLNMQKRVNARSGRTIKQAQKWVNSMGAAAVAGWALFPFVFTEAIVYVARVSGLTRKQLVTSVAIGEGILIAVIVLLTDWVVKLIEY